MDIATACATICGGELQQLNFDRHAFGDAGAKELAVALQHNETVKTLYLTSNDVGPAGARALAEALQRNGNLTTLSLYNNNIGPDGARALAESLQRNDSLTALNLAYCHVGDDGARALAKALQQNHSLTKLELESNGISDDGARALVKALQENGSLTGFCVDDNAMSPAMVEALYQLERENTTPVGAEKRRRALARHQEGAKARTAAAEEATLANTHAAVISAREVISFFTNASAEAVNVTTDATATAQRVDSLAAAEVAYRQCQAAVRAAPGEEALHPAILERNAAKQRFLAAAATSEDESETLFRLHATLSVRQAEVACTLARLQGNKPRQEPPKDEVEEASVSATDLDKLQQLVNDVEAAGLAAQKAVFVARQQNCARVETWGATTITDDAEINHRIAEDRVLAQQLQSLDDSSHRLSIAAASGLVQASALCQRRLDELNSQLKEVRQWQQALSRLLGLASQMAHNQCPSTEAVEAAMAKEDKERRHQLLAEKKLAATIMAKEVADEDGEEEEVVNKALHKVMKREKELMEAKQRRRAASAAAHEQAVALLQAIHWFPELLHRCSRLAELESAGTLDQGRCLEDYDIIRTLAGGGSKEGRHEVLLCHRKGTGEGEMCVLKRYSLAGGSDAPAARRRLLREVALLQRARHPFVAEARAVFFAADGSAAYVELAYYGGGDLGQWLATGGRGEAAVRRLLRQALLGLAAVHAVGVVHGDIKPANLFVTADGGRCVVGDFDVARVVGGPTMTTTVIGGTEEYLAPELLTPGAVGTTASDVFSFGLVAFDAFFPREEGGPHRRPSLVTRLKGEALEVPAHPQESLRQLLARMLSLQPEERPSAAEALADPYFRQASNAEGEEEEGRLWGAPRTCAVEAECLNREERAGGLTLAEGLECSERQHFVCAADLAAYVEAFCSEENGARQLQSGGVVACFALDCCGHFAAHELAQQLPPKVFGVVLAMQRRLVEQQVSSEQEDLYRRRLDDEVARLAQEGTVTMHRRRIQEELLLLRCPRCMAPFLDFTGCFALKCARCPCNFCAVCLYDCGTDAHPHVAVCPETTMPGVFGRAVEFEEAQRRRRRRLVQAYLADLPLDTREAVAAAVQQDLRDLGIDDM